jgi:hypothetical protein
MKTKKAPPPAEPVDLKDLPRQIREARAEAARTEEAAAVIKADFKRIKKEHKQAKKTAKRARKALKELLSLQKALAPRKTRPARVSAPKRLVPRNAAAVAARPVAAPPPPVATPPPSPAELAAPAAPSADSR